MKYHVGRKDKEITDLTILKKILKSAKFVTIAMCRHNEPYLVSLSYGYDEENTEYTFTVRRRAKNWITSGKTTEYGAKCSWILVIQGAIIVTTYMPLCIFPGKLPLSTIQ